MKTPISHIFRNESTYITFIWKSEVCYCLKKVNPGLQAGVDNLTDPTKVNHAPKATKKLTFITLTSRDITI